MHPILERRLLTDFPLLYQRGLSFECESGWYSLIHGLSTRLEAIAEQQRAHGLDPVMARQVKQKFGVLRFYADHAETPEIRDLIRDVEDASLRTCELCGEPGSRFDHDGQLMTRCPAHQPISVL